VNAPRVCTAAVLRGTGDLRIEDLEIPDLGFGQVLVKVRYSGVCRSQLMEFRGLRGNDRWLPHLFGHEGFGEVIEVGQGVTKVATGDNVVMGWIAGSGVDAQGTQFRSGDGTVVNAGPITTFSNFTVASENRLTRAPSGLAPDVAVLYGCALLTGAGIVLNEMNAPQNARIGVLGLGGVGLSALMTLISMGYTDLVAIDSSPEKLDFARELGVPNVILSEDLENNQQGESVYKDFDYVIESAGRSETIELAFTLVRRFGGKVFFASHPPHGQMISLDPYDLICGKEVRGTWGGSTNPDRDIPKLFDLLNQSGVRLESLLTRRYRLEQLIDALHDLEHGTVFRPLIVFGNN